MFLSQLLRQTLVSDGFLLHTVMLLTAHGILYFTIFTVGLFVPFFFCLCSPNTSSDHREQKDSFTVETKCFGDAEMIILFLVAS